MKDTIYGWTLTRLNSFIGINGFFHFTKLSSFLCQTINELESPIPEMKYPSLLPYLSSDRSKLFIDIPDASPRNHHEKSRRVPFTIIDESYPFSKIYTALIKTDALSDIKRYLLLLEKDTYEPLRKDWYRFNNQIVSELWKASFQYFEKESIHSDMIRLKDQIGNGKELLPFQSLFFCKAKQAFFHPICPKCGTLLNLCQNDDLLIEYHLQPYSTSLKRYLYCRNCLEKNGTSDFYVLSIETGDPDGVKDFRDLIVSYENIDSSFDEKSGFPCTACPEHNICYTGECKAGRRIVPFAFYPFYMMIFPAPALCSIDFLRLLSGAPSSEIKARLSGNGDTGRASCVDDFLRRRENNTPLFFENDGRRISEILYLKLSFLSELCENTFSRWRNFINITNQLSLESIWVDIPEQNSRLPYFYNFNLSLINPINFSDPGAYLDKLPESNTLYFLGTSWFRVLLSNGHQDDEKVLDGVGSVVAEMEGELSENPPRASWKTDPMFAPENIGWRPETAAVDSYFMKAWNQALNLGFTLLEAAYLPTGNFAKERFITNLENLRESVKQNLFTRTPQERKDEFVEENRAISAILNSLRPVLSESLFNSGKPEKNRETSADDAETTSTPVTPIDTAAIETIVPDNGQDDTVVQQTAEDEERLESTVVGIRPGRPIGPEQKPERKAEEHLEQTVIQSDSGAIHTTMTPPLDEEPFEATMVQSPKDRFGPEERSTTTADKNDDIVTETVIMSSKEPISTAPSENADDSDALNQTMMIARSEEKIRSRMDPARLFPKDDDDTMQEKPSPSVQDNGISAEGKIAEDDEPMEKTVIIQPEKKPKK